MQEYFIIREKIEFDLDSKQEIRIRIRTQMHVLEFVLELEDFKPNQIRTC